MGRKGGVCLLTDRLKKLRKEKKLSQYEVAEKLGFSRGKLANYEQGSRQPDYETLEKLADFYGCSIDYLLGRSNDPRLTESEQKEVDKRYKEILEILETLPEDKKEEKIEQIKTYAKFIRDQK